MRFIVTGGCGFIGSNIVDYLITLKQEVCVIDNLSSEDHEEFYYNEKAKYFHYDVNDYVMCSDVFDKFNPDIVLHLAAEARIQSCINDPSKAFETNTMGTLNILSLCLRYKVKRLVFSSTSAVYGSHLAPHIETTELDCLNPYSLSKKHSEESCKLYSNLYGLDTVCLRYFNVYGPRNPSKGQYAPVIAIFQNQKRNNKPLTIVGDGNQTRDFIHVSDIAKANYMAALSDIKFAGEIFNVGTGKSYSINDIAYKIEKDKHKHLNLSDRIGEVRHSKANIEKITNSLKWSPSIDLMEWLDKTEIGDIITV